MNSFFIEKCKSIYSPSQPTVSLLCEQYSDTVMPEAQARQSAVMARQHSPSFEYPENTRYNIKKNSRTSEIRYVQSI